MDKQSLIDGFVNGSADVGQYAARNKISAHKLRKIGREILGEKGWVDAVASKKRKQSQYALGRQFEYRTRDMLEMAGYFVFRSAQSRGVADLIAFKKGEVLFVQCKRGGSINTKEVLKLLDVCESIGTTAAIAERLDGIKTNIFIIERDGDRFKKIEMEI